MKQQIYELGFKHFNCFTNVEFWNVNALEMYILLLESIIYLDS